MMGLLDVLNWRDVVSVSCACWAGVLGDQAVNVVGQNSGLTARNQSHGEVTAIDQSQDHTRGGAARERDRAISACGWGMADDKWGMADDKWGMADDKWGMADDKCEMRSGG